MMAARKPAAPAAPAPARAEEGAQRPAASPRPGLRARISSAASAARAAIVKRLGRGEATLAAPEPELRTPLLDPVAPAAASAAPYAGQELDEDDARLLPFVFLYRSRMHAVDLRRELDDITGADGLLLLRGHHVTDSESYRIDVTIQVAVEVELEREECRRRLEVDPEFRRLVHDALYYPSWSWRRSEVLDLTDAGKPAFARYLESRMDSLPAAAGGTPPAGPPPLSERDTAFLLDRARGVARLLAARGSLLSAFAGGWTGYAPDPEHSRVKKIVQDLLRRDTTRPSLLMETGTHAYRWLYDTTGAVIPAEAAAVVDGTARPAEWRGHAEYIQALESALAGFVGAPQRTSPFAALATRFHVLGTSPTWPAVSDALRRLQAWPDAPGPAGEASLQGDAKLVRDFAELLRRSGETLGMALFCGTAAGGLGGSSVAEKPERLWIGLGALADAYRFAMLDEDLVRERLRRLVAELGELVPGFPGFAPLPAVRGQGEVPGWRRALDEQLDRVRAVTLDRDRLHSQAVESLRTRIAELITTRAAGEPALAEVLAAPVASRVLRLVRFNLAEMSAGDWSNLAYEALVVESVDPWFGFAALAVLGVPVPGWAELWSWLRENGFLKKAPYDTPPDVPFPVPGEDRGVVLLVRRGGPTSIADRWPVVPDTPAVLLREVEVNAILGRFRKQPRKWLPGLRVSTVAFEMPPETDGADTATLRKIESRMKAVPGHDFRLLFVYPDAPAEGAREPYIFSPRGVRDLRVEPVPPR